MRASFPLRRGFNRSRVCHVQSPDFVGKLADKILQPVLGKMNLEIPTPDGIADLDRHLVSIQSHYQSMLRAVDTLQSELSRKLDRQLRWVQSESRRSIKVQSNPNPIRQPPTQQPPKQQGPAMFLTFG